MFEVSYNNGLWVFFSGIKKHYNRINEMRSDYSYHSQMWHSGDTDPVAYHRLFGDVLNQS